jgi:predicted acyl esterase
MRKLAVLLALLPALVATPTQAAAPPTFDTVCPVYGDLRICSGEVPSFDGTRLDADLTLPMAGTSAPHPLIAMLHGFGNNKHEWESLTDTADGADKWHWNNHWFAVHGFYVLNYTARGFDDPNPGSGDQPATPGGTSASPADPYAAIHLKSREFEIRDTQWLAALAARAFPNLDRQRVAVTGGSYGGGESWLQASQPVWNFPHRIFPGLPVLTLQVAVPKYPWTDLAYSLAPNGHGGGPNLTDIYQAAQGQPSNREADDNPFGVPKQSYESAFFALGSTNGRFTHLEVAPYSQEESPPPAGDGPVSTDAWFVRGAADPYLAADPIVRQIRRGLTVYRGSYYQASGWAAQRASGHETAVFSISGWTDDLFPPVESFRQFKYLKRLDPLWPVAVATADIGHPRAQNKSDAWQRLNDQAWQFLQANLNPGSHRRQTVVTSQQTTCPSQPAAGSDITASTPEGLANGSLNVAYTGADALTQASGSGDPDSPNTDAVLTNLTHSDACKTSLLQTFPGRFSGTSLPLQQSRRYAGLGEVDVPYTLTGLTASLVARLWDVGPDGSATLVTRGAYRVDPSPLDSRNPDPLIGTLRLPFYGNDWTLQGGHSLRLDLAQVDSPTYLQDKTPSTLAISNPVLKLPTVETGTVSTTGSQTST